MKKRKLQLYDYAIVSLGSNLSEPSPTIEQAFCRLQTLTDAPLVRSSVWRSIPVDNFATAPKFINAIAAFKPRPGEDPASLLAKLHLIEAEFGKQNSDHKPRALDLDLITFRSVVRRAPDPVLPHPRAHLRRFVLVPLTELSRDYRFPGHTLTVSELLRNIKRGEILAQV